MPFLCINRLTVTGSGKDLKRWEAGGDWIQAAGGKYSELLEHSARRQAWQFETAAPPLEYFKHLSTQWPRLIFIVEYDEQGRRVKGLAKMKAGKLEHYCVRYRV